MEAGSSSQTRKVSTSSQQSETVQELERPGRKRGLSSAWLPDPDRQIGNGQLSDTVEIDKEQKIAVVTDVAMTSDSNIWKKEYNKLEKYKGLKEELELEKIWKVKAKVDQWW